MEELVSPLTYRSCCTNVQQTGSNISTLVGNRFIMSSADGMSYVEAALTADNGVTMIGNVIKLGGTCTIPMDSSCLPPSLPTLSVSGSTTLGSTTSCAAPLGPSCIALGGQQCSSPLAQGCTQPDLILNSLTVGTLVVHNTSAYVVQYTQFNSSSFQFLTADHVVINGPVQCNSSGSISGNCIDISAKVCTPGHPLAETCMAQTFASINQTITDTLTLNKLVCTGGALSDTCIGQRIASINGVFSKDYGISAGLGMGVTQNSDGIVLLNTGVTSLGFSPSDEFTVSSATGAVIVSKVNQSPGTFWAGPINGSPSAPGFRSMVKSDLNGLGLLDDELLVGTTSSSPTSIKLAAGDGISLVRTSGFYTFSATRNGTLTSVGLDSSASEFIVSGSPLTGAGGTLTLSKATQSAGTFWAGPVSGGAAVPGFRSMVKSDLSGLGLLDDELVVGVTGSTPLSVKLAAGDGISIQRTTGFYTFSSTRNGTVTSVDASVPSSLLSVIGGPITGAGTLAMSLVIQAPNAVFAGPSSGVTSVQPTFRALVPKDLPLLAAGTSYMGNGTANVQSTLAGGM